MSLLLAAAAVAICAPRAARQLRCGCDTFWHAGEKIRLADIDAPELNGKCSGEMQRAVTAQERLLELLNSDPFEIHRQGEDRYGRTLAVVANTRGSIGGQLVREGLARTWGGRREPWC